MAFESQQELNAGGTTHNGTCYQGTCSEYHYCILIDGDLVDKVSNAIESGDVATLQKLVSANSEYLHLNSERGAVQVTGCADDIIAQFPVPEALRSSVGFSPSR
jgi:hypothetical protein